MQDRARIPIISPITFVKESTTVAYGREDCNNFLVLDYVHHCMLDFINC